MTRHNLAFISISLALATFSAAPAAAQELTMPPRATVTEEAESVLGEAEEVPVGPADDAEDPHEYQPYDNFRNLEDDASDMWGYGPALTESTGSWLRRGWWYTEIDAVVMNRQWKRDDLVLAVDNTPQVTTRRVTIMRSDPGAEGSVRLTLGRFLFRDLKNRDHTMEFTAFGGGEWGQDDTMTSATGGQTLQVLQGISDFNPAFDGADSMQTQYDSRFSSFELNYRVKERMRGDRMILTPSGEWVRQANEGVTKQFLVGLRYMDLQDILDWRATNIATFGDEDGRYLIDTNNDMFGLQLGCSLLFERSRWNLEVGGKGGPYINDVKSTSELMIDNDEDSSFSVNNRESTLSFIGEFQLIGRYHLRPNLSLRAGWQMMYVTSVALAPDQLTFSPDPGRFPYTGDPFYQGGIFGFEGYW